MPHWVLCPIKNGLHYTKNAVADFLAQDIGDVGVLIIDNDSADGTGRWLAASDVFYMHNRPGKSVAASWNQGLNYVFQHDTDHCLVVNNDVRLRPDTYRHLAEDGGDFVTAVGSRDEECIQSLAVPDPNRKRLNPDYSCYLIRRRVWDTVGPFDENFKVGWGEDCDHHLRMEKAGIHAVCLDLPFLHYASGTIKCASEEDRQTMAVQADANREYFKRKWGFALASAEYYAQFQGGRPRAQ